MIKLAPIVFIVAFLLTGVVVVQANAEAPELSAQELYDLRLEQWTDSLGDCESDNNASAVNPNDSGSPSYGEFQFKLGTFWSYNKELNVFPELTLDTLHKYVMDGEKSRTMVKAIVTQEKDGWSNWYNCVINKGVGKPPVMQ